MLPKKDLATAESNSVDNNTSVNTGPDTRPLQPSTAPSAESLHMRRRSHSSLRSEPDTHTRTRTHTCISCVSRETTSGEDCPRHRFALWAAVERNRSVRKATSERLRCPLLLCGEQFEEHEEVLRHLTQCQHLSTDEYVCYECMKVEHFNDKKCTCFLGQPTKRKRSTGMKKHFFPNFGSAKYRRGSPITHTHNAQLCPLPKFDSLVVDTHERYGQERIEQPVSQGQSHKQGRPLEPGRDQPALNRPEFLGLDLAPLPPMAKLGTVNRDAHPTSMLSPCVKDKAPIPPTPDTISKPRPSHGFSTTHRLEAGVSGSIKERRPSLVLDTRVDRYRTKLRTKNLSPSSSFPSCSPGISPILPWTASPKSPAIWSPALSQDTALASPVTPLSARTRPTITLEDHVFSTEKDTEMLTCPEDPCYYRQESTPELRGDKRLPAAIPQFSSDSLMFAYAPKANFSWIPSMDTKISLDTSVYMMFTDPNTKANMSSSFLGPQTAGLERKSLVDQVWDALGGHFSISVSKLNRLQNNPLANNLRVQTLGAVASAGLTRLKKFINHNHHTRPDPLEYLCFVHLIYSMSLVIHEDGLTVRPNKLYGQAMAYSEHFGTAIRDDYRQIVTAIWQQDSQGSASRGQPPDLVNRATGNNGKESDGQISRPTTMNHDPLVTTGQNFLDELESIVVRSNIHHPIEVLHSDLWASHLHSNQPNLPGDNPLTVASTYLVQDLCHKYYNSESFRQQLQAIGHDARRGYYPSLRKLELELMQTGKDHFTSYDCRVQYNLEVRGLCDHVYVQLGTRRRAEYHLLGISLVESLFRSISRSPQQLQGHAEYPLIPYEYEDEFLQTWNYQMLPIAQHPVNTEGIADFGSSLDLAALHSVASNAQQTAGSPNHLPIKADASETASESYAVSPAPLSDAAPEIKASRSYRPTPPFQDQREGSENSCPSTLVSSGQKVEANERCEICGYRPKGDPQWFKGSMAKHKKMQHSTNPPIIYKCPFPGCNSEYKNRRDNLRQHQIEKNHFVGDEARRPPKRKRNEHT